jgi:hypothetical protein
LVSLALSVSDVADGGLGAYGQRHLLQVVVAHVSVQVGVVPTRSPAFLELLLSGTHLGCVLRVPA